jgi:hypothetical protein
MADYIHVERSTFRPIPRISANFAIENITAADAAAYNSTNGVTENRAYLPILRPADPVVADPVVERLVMPQTAGFSNWQDDLSGATTRDYDGAPDKAAPDVSASWVIQRVVQPQTLQGAKNEAQFRINDQYEQAIAIGYPYLLPGNGNIRRVPFTSEFVKDLYSSCAVVDFAQAQGRNVSAQIYIETEVGNFLRPRVEVAGNVADMIVKYNEFRGIYAQAVQSVRQATTPAECRTVIDAVTYPEL